jgi:hypothetical protein
MNKEGNPNMAEEPKGARFFLSLNDHPSIQFNQIQKISNLPKIPPAEMICLSFASIRPFPLLSPMFFF